MSRLKRYILRNKWTILLSILFAFHIFLRFYQIELRNQFTWDQVDNAWAAKNILVDHKLPLLGMVAKQNTSFYIGPLYYYLITPFYWLSNLDPIASGIFAGVSSIVTFFVLFFVIKKTFSTEVALVALFIHTFSLYIINLDRVQWPINFIAPVSLLIFFFLRKVMLGELKYIYPLFIFLGISFHLNFTAIFFPIIVFLSLPFFPRTKEAVKTIVFALPTFLIWLVPNIIAEFSSTANQGKHIINYVSDYTHGFHLQRMVQLKSDAFIEFEGDLGTKLIKPFELFLIPIFSILYKGKNNRERIVTSYLLVLWFLVPWIVFTLYKGEISNYYFSATRPFVLIILAYFTVYLFSKKIIMINLSILIIWIWWASFNFNLFLNAGFHGLAFYRQKVINIIKGGGKQEFVQGLPESYIYYVYQHNKLKK